MKKIYIILLAAVAALGFTACSDGDQPSGESIFVNDSAAPDAFEQWLLENFTYPYLGENTGIFGYDDNSFSDDEYLDDTGSEDNYSDGGSGTSSSSDNYIPGGNSNGNSGSGTVNDPYSDSDFLGGGGGRMSW